MVERVEEIFKNYQDMIKKLHAMEIHYKVLFSKAENIKDSLNIPVGIDGQGKAVIIPRGNNTNPHKGEFYKIECAEQSRKIKEYKKEIENLKRHILILLKDLSAEEYGVITLRYLAMLSWPEISKALNYSQRHCIRLKDSGMEKLSKKL